MKKYLVSAAIALATLSVSVQAAPGGKQEQVMFAAGKTSKTVKGSIKGYDYIDYLVTARAGQTLAVNLKCANPQAYFNINTPGTVLALYDGTLNGNTLKGRRLANDGTYGIRVFMMRAAAGRNETADYSLDIGITGQPLAPLPDKMDARVGKTPYHATATVPAKYYLDPKLTSCEAGVIRRGKDGTATVVIKQKDFQRCILFVEGKPVDSDSAEKMQVTKKGDLTTITFGDKSEVYEIRDVFVMGDQAGPTQ
ncbi:MAG: hypothetical protein U0931_11435 [Vulcanimicrobiota bacterium]